VQKGGRKMNRYKSLLVLSVLILISCAGMEPVRNVDLSNMYFASENPHLIVQIIDKFTQYRGKEKTAIEKGYLESYTFETMPGEFFYIQILDMHAGHVDYCDEWIVGGMMDGFILGKELINDKNWLKVILITKDGYSVGYYSRQGDYFIFVTYNGNTFEYKNEMENYKKTNYLKTDVMEYLETQMNMTKYMFRIVE
jgi:hypothetical protein